LATTTNILNELQPLAIAPIYTEIGLFPARIVTRLSQENGHRSDFASASLEMTSHFEQIHSSLRNFTIEIG
jgi:hypothetical protein